MRRNAHVFPGNSGASALGNRAGEGELKAGSPFVFTMPVLARVATRANAQREGETYDSIPHRTI